MKKKKDMPSLAERRRYINIYHAAIASGATEIFLPAPLPKNKKKPKRKKEN